MITGVVAGTTYNFRYRAVNSIGPGNYSDVASIVASTVPDVATVVSINESSLNSTEVYFNWTAPDSRGDDITNYKVSLNASSASLEVVCETTTASECYIPMSTLWSSPYDLRAGDLI